MSIKKKINFIFFYSFYRPGPGPRHIFVDPGAAAVLRPGIREREKIPGRPHTCPFSILHL